MRLNTLAAHHLRQRFERGYPVTRAEIGALFDYIAELERSGARDPFLSADVLPVGRGGHASEDNELHYPRGRRRRAAVPEPERSVARFGSRLASALLILELGAARRIRDDFDAEWYEGEFLYRLRNVLFSEPGFDEGSQASYDSHARFYQYAAIDMEALLVMPRGRYRDILVEVLRSLYRDERLGSRITRVIRARFRLPEMIDQAEDGDVGDQA